MKASPPRSLINRQLGLDDASGDESEDALEESTIGNFQNMKVAKAHAQVERPQELYRMTDEERDVTLIKIVALGIAAFSALVLLLAMLENIRQGRYIYHGFFKP